MKNGDIVKQWDTLDSQRSSIKTMWDAIEKIIAPYRGDFFVDPSDENAVDWDRRYVFDGTAIMANQNLAASIHSNITNPAFQFFEVGFRDDVLSEDQASKEWVEKCSKLLYEELQDSNFNTEAPEVYMNMTTFAEGPVFQEQKNPDGTKWKGIEFAALPVKECCAELDASGRVLRFYRKLNWTLIKIAEKFGTDTLPQELQEAMKSGKTQEKHELIFCIFKRDLGPEGDSLDLSKPIAPKKRPYGCKYVLKKGAKTLGEEGGYYEMPVFYPFWRKNPDSAHGYCPAMFALGDALTLNKLVELVLRAGEKAIDPCYMGTDRGVIGDLDLSPGGFTQVREMGQLEELTSSARFDVSAIQIEKLQRQIEKYFYVDQLELKESPAMTATEASIRYELIQRLLGSTLGRIVAEFLDPMIERAFNIMWRAGRFPEPPKLVLERKAVLDITYTGPMAQAQRFSQVANVERWLGFVLTIGKDHPEAMDIPNIEEIIKGCGDMLNVPARFINEATAIKAKRKQREDVQARASNAMIAKDSAAAANQMAEADMKQGSSKQVSFMQPGAAAA